MGHAYYFSRLQTHQQCQKIQVSFAALNLKFVDEEKRVDTDEYLTFFGRDNDDMLLQKE